ncbi:hypothetical protein R1flu_007806 [Riccia fluitans]|uniref:Uncharacterized protein n=1 Tax=Riccia fluitans TaxID=41844 RepID=A0ABD1Z2Y7_9MARC
MNVHYARPERTRLAPARADEAFQALERARKQGCADPADDAQQRKEGRREEEGRTRRRMDRVDDVEKMD